MSLLTDEQTIEFKRNGFVVLDDALDAELVEMTRDRVLNDDVPHNWDELEEMLDTPEEELAVDIEGRNVKMRSGDFKINAPQDAPIEEINHELFPYAEELVGEGKFDTPDGHARIVLRFPLRTTLTSPNAPQVSNMGSHVDGVNVGGTMPTFGCAIYLNRIQPRGGGFSVWPGSHHLVARYYREEAEDIYAADGGIPALNEDGTWDEDRQLSDQFDPVEVSGDPGTVVLWHGHLEHAGGINLQPGNVRMAMFSRFNLPDTEYDDPMDYAANPFEYWDGLRDVELDAEL